MRSPVASGGAEHGLPRLGGPALFQKTKLLFIFLKGVPGRGTQGCQCYLGKVERTAGQPEC